MSMITQSWDTAHKAAAHNDPSVCLTAQKRENGVHRILDVAVMRLEYPELKRRMVELAARWQPHAILIEDKASGQSLLQDMRREQPQLPVIAMQPKADKVTRFAQVTPMIEAGRVALPREASWLAEFEAELVSFPNGAHDDQVDALSQYLNWVRTREAQAMKIRAL